MPRQPTGRPRGRPVGSGTLGEQTRVTIRIPTALYARLEAYAEGRSFARDGSPQFAACVREALEHYLTCPQKRQTQARAVSVTVTDTDAAQTPPRRRTRQAAHAD